MWEAFDDHRQYAVVINHEEQYSIWPVEREVPMGWTKILEPDVAGFAADALSPVGSKAQCIAYIEEVWTDMRPLSFHQEMAEEIRRQA